VPAATKALHTEPLARTEALKLVKLLLGGEIAGLNQRICDVAEGNPYYIEEIIKHLASTGMLVIADGAKPQLTKPLDEIPLPPTLSAFITQKADSCPPLARKVLAALAVLESADVELLGEVSGVKDVAGALSELDKQYLIAKTKEGIYSPANDLVMDTVLRGMLASDRRRMHAGAASTLIIRQQSGEERLAAIIHHLLEAGRNEEAVPWLMESGSRVLAQGALEAALGVFHQARALLGTDSDFHLRMKVTMRKLDVLLDLFRAKEALAIIKEIPMAECSAQESAELSVLTLLALLRSDDLNEALKLIPECLAQEKNLTQASRAVLHLYIAQSYARSQRLGDAMHEARLSLRRAHGLADIAVAAQANNVLGVLLNQLGKREEALRYLFEALRLRRRIGKKDEIASTLANIATAYLYLNRIKPLKKYAAQALAYARASGDVMAEGSSLINLGLAALSYLDWDEAEDYFRKAYDLFDGMGAENPKFIAELNLALIQINTGYFGKAIHILTKQRKALEKSGELTQIRSLDELLVEIYYMHGDFKQALILLTEYLVGEHGRDKADKLEYMQGLKITLEFLLGEGNGFDDPDLARASRRLRNLKSLHYNDFVPFILDCLYKAKPIAKAVLNCIQEVINDTREKQEKLQLQMLQGIVSLCNNDYPTAIDSLKKVLAQFKKAKMNYFVVLACLHLGRALRRAGQSGQAVKVLGSADRALGIVGNQQLAQAMAREMAWAGGEQPAVDDGYCGQL
jgi:tetratricopeptide (TPR) repeat protein